MFILNIKNIYTKQIEFSSEIGLMLLPKDFFLNSVEVVINKKDYFLSYYHVSSEISRFA